ncbi:MAG: hypothetical protein HFH67_05265 [Lachnospiraceae bacterium]|nr:hypothetical protein [Lachnospiraceae bacterium]
MAKLKKIFAAAGVVLLLGMYLLTFISAMLATPNTHSLFLGSLAAIIIVPIFLYAYTLIYKVIYKDKGKQEDKEEKD